MSDQTRTVSIVESALNTASGFALAWAAFHWVVRPVFGFEHATPTDTTAVTALFTVLSLGRNYFWRRFFANKLHERIIRWTS